MKILHITKTYDIGGMFELTRQISERLVKSGHDVTVATRKINNPAKELRGVKIAQFDIQGNWVNGFTTDLKDFHEFIIKSNFDIITSFAGQHTLTDAFLKIIDEVNARKVFVPTGFSALYNAEYSEYYKQMIDWMNKYHINIFSSDDYRDINYARQHNLKNITVIPNGASIEEFIDMPNISKTELGFHEDDFIILHIGSHTGQKGHKEAMQIFEKSNIKNSTLVIVASDSGVCYESCKETSEKLNQSNKFIRNNKKIIVKSFNRQNTVSLLKMSDLFLFPSNIECSPIVLFEAMASKTPFLVTDVGNSKEIIKWSNSGILLPTYKRQSLDIYPIYIIKKIIKSLINKKTGNVYSVANVKKSAKIIEKLYNNRDEINTMANNGHKAWLERFTWEKIAKDYENIYETINNNKI